MANIETEIKSKFKDPYSKLWINLIFTSSWINAVQADAFKPYNLSAQQFNILRILKGFGDWMKIHDIKSRMLDKSPNMTRLVDKLIDKNLIERRRCDQDRRVIYAQITTEGLDLLKKIDKDLGPLMENSPLKQILGEAEAEELSQRLDQIREVMDQGFYTS